MIEKLKYYIKFVFLALTLSSFCANANNEAKETILRSLENFAKTHRIQAAYSISRGENNLVSSAQGYADLMRNKRLSNSQIFPILSLTKQFTAAAILILSERNILNLNDNLLQHSNAFKDLWKDGNNPNWLKDIKIHNLLSHSSGLEDYIGKFNISEEDSRQDFEKKLGGFLFEKSLKFTPGKAYCYNNTNYYLLGLIIEKLSGMELGVFFQKEFFDPLGMKNTYFLSFKEAFEIQKNHLPDKFPIRYFLTPTENHPKFSPVPTDIILIPGGDCGLVSNAKDLILWNKGLHNGKILSRTSYKKMTTRYYRIKDKRNGYISYIGYGTYISVLHNGKKYYHHDTGGYGIRCDAGYIPKDNLSLAILSNVAFNIPSNMASRVDFRRPENQVDISYLRDAMLEAL